MKQIILSLILASCVLAQDPNDAPTFSNLPAAGLLEADFHLLGVDLIPNANTQVAGKYLTILNAVADDLFNNWIHGIFLEPTPGNFSYDPDGAGPLIGIVFNAVSNSAMDSSAELRAIVTDESGTGALLFAEGALGAATATTAAVNDNDTSVSTTAYVQTEIDALEIGSIQFSVDGGGAVIATGTQTAKVVVPYACTIIKATVLSDASTNSTVDIWMDSYANYPPTIADTIVAAAKPTLSAAVKSEDSTLTGWTLTVLAGSIFYIAVDTNSAATHLDIVLTTTR